ncbi:hypothetical protein [Lysinibacillus capsici]|uniref:hypothetical protein n=1 Tax=Lysinibacillus capsici TaxID=2115968 RepID=UPI0034E3D85A
MATDKIERVEIVNKLIKFISERGRRFFYRKETLLNKNKDFTAYMKIKNNRIYYVDDYTQTEIPMVKHGNWQGFSHGGTLRALVSEFAYFIRTGIPCNGKYGYGGLYSGDWGHSDEIQQEIINYAKEIGYLKG